MVFHSGQRNRQLAENNEKSAGSGLDEAKGFPIAAIVFERGFDIDGLLGGICQTAVNAGINVGGLIQETRGGIGGCAQSVHVVDIQSGEKFDIWEDRGREARGCRLDEEGLIISARILDKAIKERVDLLIINRFGRAEGLGRGLVGSFAQALEAGIPLLTSVREPYTDAWRQFHGGLACELESNRKAVDRWLAGAVLNPRTV